jgi:trehalose synthase
MVHEVPITAVDVRQLGRVVAPERVQALLDDAERLRTAIGGGVVTCVSSTEAGGGVAEMLHVLLPYARGAGIDARWMVIEGDPEFFAITKRLHNVLHGVAGDGGPLGDHEREHYEAVLRHNATRLAAVVRPGDVVLLHDPQPAGLADIMRGRGARVIWRCHIGTDTFNDRTDAGWAFLRPYLDGDAVDAYVFTSSAFAPGWMPAGRVYEIEPSIDPFSPKNQELSVDQVRAVLASVGVLAGDSEPIEFQRPDGTWRRIERAVDLVRTGPLPGPDVPLVVQVSRWDRLKDMTGVMHGFAEFVVRDHGAQLVLAGPVVTAVADDPEGGAVLRETWEAWRALPHHARRRVGLVCVPMADPEENAVIVNALQRHATVVVQKSLAEGFGLTVSEAMFKARPVIGSAVGGIRQQIVDGETGVLLADPTDLDAFAGVLGEMLGRPEQLEKMGRRAHDRVVDRFLPDTQLARWSAVLSDVLG